MPGFWYQGYQRSVSSGSEVDTINGTPGRRLRFTPPEMGGYPLAMTIGTNGQIMATLSTSFSVANRPTCPPGMGMSVSRPTVSTSRRAMAARCL